MAFAFLFIGLIIVIAAARGNLATLGDLLKSEFTGSGNFFYWLLAIGIIGSFGYMQSNTAKAFSRSFMTLILISMVLANRGVFSELMSAVNSIGSTPSTAGQGTAVGNTVSNTPANQGGTPANTGAASGSSSGGSTGTNNAATEVAKDLALAQNVTSGLNSILSAGGSKSQILNVASGLGGAISKFAGLIGGFL